MDNSIRTAAIASLVKNCDKTSLNEAFKAMFGVSLLEYFRELKEKRSNLDFGDFRMQRYAQKDSCVYMGKRPAPNGIAENLIYKLEVVKIASITYATCTINGNFLFSMQMSGYNRCQKMAISALKAHIYITRAIHRRRRNSKKGMEA